MTTPPGWYPDPGQTPQLPPQERWWDGSTWTSHTRPGTGVAAPLPGRGGGAAGRGPLVAGIVGSIVLAAALAVGGVLLLGGSDGSDDKEPEAASSSSSKPSESPEAEKPGPDDDDKPAPHISPGEVVSIPRFGVGMTVPQGWELKNPDSSFLSYRGSYPCPKPQSTPCVRGGAALHRFPGVWGKDSLKQIAEAEVAKNAKESYGKKAYGGITSHKVTESGEVTVAGRPGYRIRWRVENKLEPDADVEAVVFRSPHDRQDILVMWSSVDVSDGGPSAADLDELRKGLVKTELGRQDDGNTEAV
ncbi:DUF2510 domain-containing protein [Streptomyces smyrnaeus]|uniref:DUF2510 domain-containing protein n=1 Tax=Streptomyces smyrnaeus TaxID=1387713 RepID=UPI003674AB5F